MQLLGLSAYFHLIFNLCAIGITTAIALIKTALFKVESTGKILCFTFDNIQLLSWVFVIIEHQPGSTCPAFVHYCASTSAMNYDPIIIIQRFHEK